MWRMFDTVSQRHHIRLGFCQCDTKASPLQLYTSYLSKLGKKKNQDAKDIYIISDNLSMRPSSRNYDCITLYETVILFESIKILSIRNNVFNNKNIIDQIKAHIHLGGWGY